jgi:hypothetical protein
VKAFPTPEAAVEALIVALQAQNLQPLTEIFEPAVLESIPPEERRSDAERRAAGQRLASEPRSITYKDPERTKARVIVGKENFVLPIPMVKSAKGWVFDGAAGVAEMNQQRAVTNESNAIRALRSLWRAQELYHFQDRDGDGIVEYAQRIRGTEGRLDGLVNEGSDVPGTVTSLLNDAFAKAEAKPGSPEFYPVGGYGYAILTAQGANAAGGARNYLVNGKLRDGYAVIAWPTRPGVTGESTFLMNQDGAIYEREFGAKTLESVRQISAFDPDKEWKKIEND